MKKLIAVLAVLAMLTSLFAACSEKETINADAADGGEGQLALGVTSGDTYTNDSVGVTFKLPDGWVFYTDEEIAEIMNISADELFADKTILDSIEMTTVTDFMAMDPGTGDSVSLMFESLSATGNEDMTVMEYADVGVKMLKEQLEVDNMEFGERTIVRLGDADFLRMSTSFSIGELKLTQWQYIRKVGDFVIVIGTTAVSDRSAEDFEGMFS